VIVSGIRRLLTGGDESKVRPPSVYASIYPESVRYALQYKAAKMGKTEMSSLLEHYVHETVYLVTKALASNRENQRKFLEQLSRLYIKPDWTENALRTLVRGYIDALPDDTAVDGAKLAQLNRSGTAHWQKAFRALAIQCRDIDFDKLPVLIAHTPVFAFHHFIEIFAQMPAAKFLLIVPKWMEDPSETHMGYEIELKPEPVVRFQEKDECIFGQWVCRKLECKLKNKYCGNCIFIDDTIKTESTAQKVRSFWQGEYGRNIPDERIRVITDLRR
jgi:hypothetical protein